MRSINHQKESFITIARKQILIIFFSILFFECSAQSAEGLAGIWSGRLKDTSGEFEYGLKLERKEPGVYIGVSTSRSASFFCETKIVGIQKNGRLLIHEVEVLKTDYPAKEALCLLKLDISLTDNRLSGNFTPLSNTSNCSSGTLSLVKSLIDQSEIKTTQKAVKTVHTSTPSNLRGLPNDFVPTTQISPVSRDSVVIQPWITARTENKLRSIDVDDEEAELTILDNMAVDGDIITLIDNDNIVLRKVTLTKRAISYKIDNKKSPVHVIKFYAENLGSTPPNTGVLIVRTDKSVFKTDFASDFNQTATIQINLKKAL